MLTVFSYLIAIIIAEAVTVFVQPFWGIVCHISVLVAIIIHSIYAPRKFVISLSLIPLTRIISLAIPLATLPQIWWYPIIYTPILAAAIVVMRILDYKFREIGLTFKQLPIQIVIILTGGVFGVAEYFILKPQAIVDQFTWQAMWFPALILIATTGFVEELIFRGIIQRSAVDSMGWWGIVYISFLFAVLHMGFLSWVDGVFVFVVALFFGWTVKKTGSIFGVTLSHGITNVLLYLVLPNLLD